MFSAYGKVDRVLMGVSAGQNGIFRGFAYVIMEAKESAEALINIERLKFKQSTIIIKKCREQDKGYGSEDKGPKSRNSAPKESVSVPKQKNNQPAEKFTSLENLDGKRSVAAVEDNHQHSSLTPVSKSTGLDRNFRINHPFYSQDNKSNKLSDSGYSLRGQNVSRAIQPHQKVYVPLYNNTLTHAVGSQHGTQRDRPVD